MLHDINNGPNFSYQQSLRFNNYVWSFRGNWPGCLVLRVVMEPCTTPGRCTSLCSLPMSSVWQGLVWMLVMYCWPTTRPSTEPVEGVVDPPLDELEMVWRSGAPPLQDAVVWAAGKEPVAVEGGAVIDIDVSGCRGPPDIMFTTWNIQFAFK